MAASLPDAIEVLVTQASYKVGAICLYAVPITYGMHVWLHHQQHLNPSRANSFARLMLFPLKGGQRHAVFQFFSWALWALAVAITIPLYLSLKDALPHVLRLYLTIPTSHADVASGAAAVSAFIGQLFMLKALLVYEEGTQGSSSSNGIAEEGDDGRPAAAKGRSSGLRWGRILRVVGPTAASVLVVVMGMALALTGFGLLLALELMPDTASRMLYCCLALLCMLVGASSTYGLGGHLRYGMGRWPSESGYGVSGALPGGGAAIEVDGPTWRFFQPFTGGSAFVTTQAIGWTLFSSTVVMLVLLAKQLLSGVAYCLRCWVLSAGALMMATQLVLGVSVLTFKGRRRARKLLQPMLHPKEVARRGIDIFLPVFMMYMPIHTLSAALALAFVLLPAHMAVAAVVGVFTPYYAITLRGNPAHTGCRRWRACCTWFSASIEDSLAWWAGELRVIADFEGTAVELAAALEAQLLQGQQTETAHGEAPTAGATEAGDAAGNSNGGDPDGPCGCGGSPCSGRGACGSGSGSVTCSHVVRSANGTQRIVGSRAVPDDVIATGGARSARRFVLGFHPHGFYPTGAGFVPLMPSVQRLFPGLRLVTLTATIVHYLPLLREIAAWAGFRQVTRATFRKALRDEGGVLLCPGGQAELVYADRAFPPRSGAAAAVASVAAAAQQPEACPAAAAAGVTAAVTSRAPAPPSKQLLPIGGLPTASDSSSEGDEGREEAQEPKVCAEDPAPVVASAVEGMAEGSGSDTEPGQAPQAVRANGSAAAAAAATGLTPAPSLGAAAAAASQAQEPRQAAAPTDLLLAPHDRQQLVIFSGHKGFVRLALEEGAWLVPVLALGETLHLRNLIRAPKLQRWTYKRIGFPFPFMLAGRLIVTYLPLRTPLIYVIGKPLAPPAAWLQQQRQQRSTGAPGAGPGQVVPLPVPEEVVDEYHAAFYEEMRRLFDKYSHLHPSLQHAEMIMQQSVSSGGGGGRGRREDRGGGAAGAKSKAE